MQYFCRAPKNTYIHKWYYLIIFIICAKEIRIYYMLILNIYYIYIPTTPGLKSIPPCLFPGSVGLSWMICGECGRRTSSTTCTGCRTLGRIRFLWTSQIKPPDESEALGCLRFCAGGLADLVELRFSAEAQVVPAEAKAPVTGAVPGGEEVAEGEPVGVAPKEEKNSPSLEPGEGAEGESYSYETVEEGGKEAALSTEKVEEVRSQPVPRFGRGSLCKPLGLTPACKSSTRKEEEKPFVFRKDKPARQDRHSGAHQLS